MILSTLSNLKRKKRLLPLSLSSSLPLSPLSPLYYIVVVDNKKVSLLGIDTHVYIIIIS